MASAIFNEPNPKDERLMRIREHSMIIGGEDRSSADGERIGREAPGQQGFVVARYARRTAEDVDAAVAAARKAFDEGPGPRVPATVETRASMASTNIPSSRLCTLSMASAISG